MNPHDTTLVPSLQDNLESRRVSAGFPDEPADREVEDLADLFDEEGERFRDLVDGYRNSYAALPDADVVYNVKAAFWSEAGLGIHGDPERRHAALLAAVAELSCRLVRRPPQAPGAAA